MLQFCLLSLLSLLLVLLLFLLLLLSIVAWLLFFSVIFCIPISLPSPTQLLSSGILLDSTMPPPPPKKKGGEAFLFSFTLYIKNPKTVHREWNVYTRKQLKVNLKSTVTESRQPPTQGVFRIVTQSFPLLCVTSSKSTCAGG